MQALLFPFWVIYSQERAYIRKFLKRLSKRQISPPKIMKRKVEKDTNPKIGEFSCFQQFWQFLNFIMSTFKSMLSSKIKISTSMLIDS
jgi:hypothetical protein